MLMRRDRKGRARPGEATGEREFGRSFALIAGSPGGTRSPPLASLGGALTRSAVWRRAPTPLGTFLQKAGTTPNGTGVQRQRQPRQGVKNRPQATTRDTREKGEE
jgi:hypothetical protein